ncbi:MAG: DUF2069 domain-containing protein [Dokdonella sp.]|uniref:DUF2069 domain-containing protein n=1 Tax=Dokdonella sp. TaxID=2291710 RepID=UPI0032655BD0
MKALPIGLVAWALLTLLQLVWHGWLAPSTVALVITLPPLLLPLLALRKGAGRALLWVGIAALFYFCHGISEAWSEPGVRGVALVETLLCVVLIGALGWDARGYKRTR